MNYTYVISDIHGNYDLFVKLLEQIKFSEFDKMIICGDIFDKGKDSIGLLKFIRQHSNIILLIGNHEYEFLKYYNSIMASLDDNFNQEKVLDKINSYFYSEDKKLTWDDIEWLETRPYYYESNDFICVHAGLEISNKGIIEPEKNKVEFMIYNRDFKEPDFKFVYNKCILFGHTPTRYINGKDEIIMYENDNIVTPQKINDYYKIHLDCGTSFSQKLGCICLENLKTFYVEE